MFLHSEGAYVACVCMIGDESTREDNSERFLRQKTIGIRHSGEGGGLPAILPLTRVLLREITGELCAKIIME